MHLLCSLNFYLLDLIVHSTPNILFVCFSDIWLKVSTPIISRHPIGHAHLNTPTRTHTPIWGEKHTLSRTHIHPFDQWHKVTQLTHFLSHQRCDSLRKHFQLVSECSSISFKSNGQTANEKVGLQVFVRKEKWFIECALVLKLCLNIIKLHLINWTGIKPGP